ncbi:DUF6069 family protein [Spirosoma arcticum]
MLTVPPVNNRRLLTVAPLAGLIAAAVNAVLFYIGTATGAIPASLIIPNAGQPLTVIPVIVASFVPAIAAGLLLALLNRFTKRPLRIFNIIAIILLVLSFSSPFSIPNVPVGMVVILNLMHVVVAGAVLGAFNRLSNR